VHQVRSERGRLASGCPAWPSGAGGFCRGPATRVDGSCQDLRSFTSTISSPGWAQCCSPEGGRVHAPGPAVAEGSAGFLPAPFAFLLHHQRSRPPVLACLRGGTPCCSTARKEGGGARRRGLLRSAGRVGPGPGPRPPPERERGRGNTVRGPVVRGGGDPGGLCPRPAHVRRHTHSTAVQQSHRLETRLAFRLRTSRARQDQGLHGSLGLSRGAWGVPAFTPT
jgi:hypothetical protein